MSKPFTWEEGGRVAWNMAEEEGGKPPPDVHGPGRLEAVDGGQMIGREGAWAGVVRVLSSALSQQGIRGGM